MVRVKIFFSLAVVLCTGVVCSNASETGTENSSASIQALKEKLSQARAQRVESASAYALGKKLEEEGRFEQALQRYEEALASDTDYLPLKTARARVLIKLKRFKTAIDLLETLKPLNAENALLLAEAYLSKDGKTKEDLAKSLIDQALEKIQEDSSSNAFHYTQVGDRLGEILTNLKLATPTEIAQTLLPVFRKAAEQEPRDPLLQFRAAELALQAEKYEDAVKFYERTYAMARNFPNVRNHLILALLAAEKNERAIELLEEMLDIEPEQIALYPLLADLYEQTGNLGKAETAYAVAIQLGQTKAELYLRLAFIQLRAGHAERAEKTLLEAQNIFPAKPQIPMLRGVTLRKMERFEDALAAFELAEQVGALEEGFLNSNFYFEYGVTWEQAGNLAKAETFFQKAFELDPKNHIAMNYLGYSLAERGEQLEKAKELIQNALKLDPEHPAYLDSLGWVYFQQGDYQKAKELISQAAESIPEDPEVNEHLGDVYDKLGQPKKAVEHWKKALEKPIDSEQEKRLKGKLPAQ